MYLWEIDNKMLTPQEILGLKEKEFKSLPEAQAAYNELTKKVQEYSRQVWADINKIEKRLSDGGL